MSTSVEKMVMRSEAQTFVEFSKRNWIIEDLKYLLFYSVVETFPYKYQQCHQDLSVNNDLYSICSCVSL